MYRRNDRQQLEYTITRLFCWTPPYCGWLWLLVLRMSKNHCRHVTLALSTQTTTTINGIAVHAEPLFRNNENNRNSPYCFVASVPPLDRPDINFLATQVWPAARQAAQYVQRHAHPDWTVCEWGCGPGLPSLAAAQAGCRVVATDVDPFALSLVQQAAQQQGLSHVSTQLLDLTDPDAVLPPADLYILSDVFESAAVARDAARLTVQALQRGRVWVFCQSDRAQRDAYVDELRRLSSNNDHEQEQWVDASKPPCLEKGTLWLCNVDETKVSYG